MVNQILPVGVFQKVVKSTGKPAPGFKIFSMRTTRRRRVVLSGSTERCAAETVLEVGGRAVAQMG